MTSRKDLLTVPHPTPAGVLAAAALAAGCSALPATPSSSGSHDGGRELAHLNVAALSSDAGYSRGRFGPAWADVDHNHCDTRNDILARDLSDVRRRGHCTVTAGVLHDRYTGKTLIWRRGRASARVQIDHIYPLHRMWAMGAAHWPLTRREQAANDPRNLLAVDGPTNASKGDQGPDTWRPRGTEWCDYARRYTAVASAYTLPVTAADKAALGQMLRTC